MSRVKRRPFPQPPFNVEEVKPPFVFDHREVCDCSSYWAETFMNDVDSSMAIVVKPFGRKPFLKLDHVSQSRCFSPAMPMNDQHKNAGSC
jgi:hypothetical protein